MKSILSLFLALSAIAALACSYDSDYNRPETCDHTSFKTFCDEDILVSCNSNDKLEEIMCSGGCKDLKCVNGAVCDGVDAKGTCNGNVAQKCVDGVIQSKTCTGDSKCGTRSDGQVDCISRTNNEVPSYTVGQKCPKEITYDGICDGKNVVFCSNDVVEVLPCDTQCMVKESYTIPFAECYYECGDIDYKGECRENGYDYCAQNGEGLIHITCTNGQTCKKAGDGNYACL